MNTAEMIAPTVTKPAGWAEISDWYPNGWVCLVEVEHQTDSLGRPPSMAQGSIAGHSAAAKGCSPRPRPHARPRSWT